MSDEWVMVPRDLLQRVDAALQRHLDRHAPMRIPVDQTDSDLVQSDVQALITAPAAPQQAEPVEIVPRVWREALRKLTFMARTSGGTPGPDEGLQTACAEAETLLSKPYNYPPAAPQQAEPVAQIGWADEFGNLFPMGAWKPAQRTHHDSHKAAWRPVFLHPPAAEVQRLRDAAQAFLVAYDADDGVSMDDMKARDDALVELRRALEGGE